VVVDGRFVTDEPSMYLAIGEAINGPGGYFGADPDGLADCLSGGFGAAVPFALEWTSSDTARETVGTEPPLSDATGSHWDTVLTVFAKKRVTVTLR
jgi:hypothetical protein